MATGISIQQPQERQINNGARLTSPRAQGVATRAGLDTYIAELKYSLNNLRRNSHYRKQGSGQEKADALKKIPDILKQMSHWRAQLALLELELIRLKGQREDADGAEGRCRRGGGNIEGCEGEVRRDGVVIVRGFNGRLVTRTFSKLLALH
jgi:hypothetical protein